MHPKFITEVCHICEKKDTWLRCWFRRSTEDQPPPYQSAPNDQFPTSISSHYTKNAATVENRDIFETTAGF